MPKKLILAAGLLVTLGAVVSGAFGHAFGDSEQATSARNETAATQANSIETDQLLARLHTSPSSVPLARPL